MTTGMDIVNEARKWLGTPYHHQARLRGVGCDCVGLIIGVAHALSLSDFDTTDYSRQPDPVRLQGQLDEHLIRVDASSICPGDILWLAIGDEARHLGFATDKGLIHAAGTGHKVLEHSLDAKWRTRIRGIWVFPGVERCSY